jgi:hypothetical protein
MFTIMALFALAAFGFGKSKNTGGNDRETDAFHWSYVMTADGDRTSTKYPCTCSLAGPGGEHNGPWAGNPDAPAPSTDNPNK